MLWPFSRRKRRLELLAADAQVAKAEQDHHAAMQGREAAERAREEAKEMGDWAREETASNRFALRLTAAFRSGIAKEGPR